MQDSHSASQRRSRTEWKARPGTYLQRFQPAWPSLSTSLGAMTPKADTCQSEGGLCVSRGGPDSGEAHSPIQALSLRRPGRRARRRGAVVACASATPGLPINTFWSRFALGAAGQQAALRECRVNGSTRLRGGSPQATARGAGGLSPVCSGLRGRDVSLSRPPQSGGRNRARCGSYSNTDAAGSCSRQPGCDSSGRSGSSPPPRFPVRARPHATEVQRLAEGEWVPNLTGGTACLRVPPHSSTSLHCRETLSCVPQKRPIT